MRSRRRWSARASSPPARTSAQRPRGEVAVSRRFRARCRTRRRAPYPKPEIPVRHLVDPRRRSDPRAEHGRCDERPPAPDEESDGESGHDHNRPDHAIDVDVRGALLERLRQQIGPELDGEPAGRRERLQHEDRVSDRDILEVVVASLERREHRPDGRFVCLRRRRVAIAASAPATSSGKVVAALESRRERPAPRRRARARAARGRRRSGRSAIRRRPRPSSSAQSRLALGTRPIAREQDAP